MTGQVGPQGFPYGGSSGSVPANTLPKSNGTNLSASRLSDDGTDILIAPNGLPNGGQFSVGSLDESTDYVTLVPTTTFDALVTSSNGNLDGEVQIAVTDTVAVVNILADTGIVQRAPASSPASVLLNSTISFYLNEAGNKLMVAVKYSDGTAKTGEIALT